MVTPLPLCTDEEQHVVVLFLWAGGIPVAEIHCQVYGINLYVRSLVGVGKLTEELPFCSVGL
jgi:hypothetical protein